MPAKQVFPLSKLTEAIENVINSHCSKVVWVKAEIVKLNHYPHTGHCYPDLVEKKDGKIIAELRGNIWKSNFDLINNKFRNVLNEDLRDDMTVVVQATVTFHSVYGLALNILDIDPEYTLGELAKQRAEAIKKLIAEDIFDANKQQPLPQLPKTIAIISVNSSKGYQDFINVIENNPWGYQFQYKLFPAILQGERAVTTITAQLEKIKHHKKLFDAVAIIRGGGGEIGLSCYDNYQLAKKIAQFPIPVLTGIGHSTNETVSELVSYKSFITPTKIAEFLLQEFHNFSQPLRENIQKIIAGANLLFERQETQLSRVSTSFGFLANRIVDREKNRLASFRQTITSESKAVIKYEAANLKNITTSVELLSPKNIMKRGFSITRKNGKIVTNSAAVAPGDLVETEFFEGKASAEIKNTESK
ncbi:exodeoxyribonuclease VII large subunit [Salinimicrobium sp. MT39]|uniref:Exodeoxyribonuclease 7 large subunit n=1 Tax=Salinimicrobium profundisediminis TaxID=2994553 RepID=A0A9X3CW67_9FLAO|nr:exodeoxyribonuclease VII large subunit [Salinimicrobium profundisediminis]MCX2837775.1 exodeoxyribonuclease VII large subunit [Salinimicrobium profundisediminis]